MLLSSTYCLNGTVANFIIDVLMFSLLTELFISSGIFLVFIIAEDFLANPTEVRHWLHHYYMWSQIMPVLQKGGVCSSSESCFCIGHSILPPNHLNKVCMYIIFTIMVLRVLLTFFVVLDGNNWTSNFLYAGTLSGSKIACSSA